MIVVADVFDYPGDDRYTKMAEVLRYSMKKNCPGIEFRLIRIKAPGSFKRKKCFASNVVKLEAWIREIAKADDDIIFIDSDMLVLRDLADAFDDKDFDIGITALIGVNDRLPYNGGVVMMRNNEAGKAFMREWNEIDLAMYDDENLHNPYRIKYAGMNQAALGKIVGDGKTTRFDVTLQSGVRARVKLFDCREWNFCRDKWDMEACNPRLLHIKSDIRKNAFMPSAISLLRVDLRKPIMAWRKYAQEAKVMQFPEYALKDMSIKRPGVGGVVLSKNIRDMRHSKRRRFR